MRSCPRILAAAAAITLAGIASSITRATATPAELDRSLFGHYSHIQLPLGSSLGNHSPATPDVLGSPYGTGFESNESPAYTNGQTISNGTNGWSKTTAAGATSVVVDNVLPHGGSQDLLWTPAPTSPTTFLYRSDAGAIFNSGIASHGYNFARVGSNFAFVNPSVGTPNRGVFAGVQLYNGSNALIAYDIMYVDPNYATDGQGFDAAYTMETVWDSNNSGGIDAADDGWDYTFNGIHNYSDAVNRYWNLEIQATTDGQISFRMDGVELQGGDLSGGVVTTWTSLGYVDSYEGRITSQTDGTMPRIREDDFRVAAGEPEPTSIALLSASALYLAARRRRSL